MDEITIPQFTREEYLFSTAPFEWLSAFAENKFQLMQMMERVNVQACSVGIRNFKTLFKTYMESTKSTGSAIMLNATNFEGQEMQLDSGRWICDEYGVTSTDRGGAEVIACSHPIMPVQRLINIDTGTEKLKIAYKKGNVWRSLIADKRTLASNNSILSLADNGVAVNSENSRFLVRYLTDVESMNYEKIPELNSVGRLGWIPGYGFSPYVENLVFDGDVTFKHFFESVKEHGKRDKWLEVAKSVRASNSTQAKIVLAASFASALVEPCGALPFFVHMWGTSECGKSVALMLAASVWASPAMGEYIHTFNSTSVAQELSAGFVNSMPLMIDELQIIKDRKDFDAMVYQLAEGVGRFRGAKTGGLQKTSTWHNCIITNGEMPISSYSSGGGTINRIIDLECDSPLFKDSAYVAESVKKHYGYAGKQFVEYITDDTLLEIRNKQKEYIQELQKSESTDKQALSASVILTADFFAEKWIFHDGNNLTVEDITPFLSTKTDISQDLRAYEYLMDIIAMNEAKFLPTSRDITEVWGVIDDNYIYLITTKFNEILRNGGYSPTSVLSWLRKNSLIDCPAEKNRKDKVKKVGGLSRRCIWLKKQEFEMFLEGMEEMTEGPFPFDD